MEGGRSSSEGRLEVFYRGEWGTVCDDDFGLKEAQVFCNSFGLYGKPVRSLKNELDLLYLKTNFIGNR